MRPSQAGVYGGKIIRFISTILKKDLFGFLIILAATAYILYPGSFLEKDLLIDGANQKNEATFYSGQGGIIFEKLENFQLTQANSFIAYASVLHNIKVKKNQITYYSVQKGDTLSSIARDFGVSVDSIVWANELPNKHYLRKNQELRIPPLSGVVHTVRAGDTVSTLAKLYQSEVEKIVTYNNLPKDGNITIGQELIIPDGILGAAVRQKYSRVIQRTFSYLPSLSGYFVAPTKGYNWGRLHGRNGVDIANHCGTSIVAAGPGTVVIADGKGWNGGFGKYIKISHPNKTATLYAHLSKILVREGSLVQRGRLIGYMGTTGRSSGCHLHYEVHGARNDFIRY